MALHCHGGTAKLLNPKKCNVALKRLAPIDFKNQLVLWTQPDVAGWLDKRGGPFFSWQKRFFILQSSSLFYFKDNLNIESAQPQGVIPMEGSTLEVADPKSGGTQRKWCITLKLGPQFAPRRATHVLSAPSKQALEEWVEKFTTAGKTHVNLLGNAFAALVVNLHPLYANANVTWPLFDACICELLKHSQLHKSLRMGSELRSKLSKTPAYASMLANARGEEADALQKALGKVKEELVAIHKQIVLTKAKGDDYESEAMRALTLWSLLSQRLAGNKSGNVKKIIDRLQVELDLTTDLCQLLESKAGFFQGQGIEKLNEDGRTGLSLLCEKALNNILHQQARIRVQAPRYTSDVNPLIFPEHDLQFKHTSEIYDLSLNFNKSAKKKVVDLKMKTIDNVKKITTTRAPPIESAKVISSRFGAFRSMALKAGMVATIGKHTLGLRAQRAKVGTKISKTIHNSWLHR